MDLTIVVPMVTAVVSVVAILISAFVIGLTILAARRTLEKQQLGSISPEVAIRPALQSRAQSSAPASAPPATSRMAQTAN